VFAIDVGSGQLASVLRADPRVRLYERSNLRDLQLDHVGGVAVDMVVADVSFISLTLLIGPLVSVTQDDGWLLLLVKPQFEVGRELLGRDGVVHTPAHHVQALSNVIKAAELRLALRSHRALSRLPGGVRQPGVLRSRCRAESAADLDLAAIIETGKGKIAGPRAPAFVSERPIRTRFGTLPWWEERADSCLPSGRVRARLGGCRARNAASGSEQSNAERAERVEQSTTERAKRVEQLNTEYAVAGDRGVS
jgi:hypothetical protein